MSDAPFCYSTDEETFLGSFATREEALEEARGLVEDDPEHYGPTVWTGVAAPYLPVVHPWWVLDGVGEQAYDNVGDAAEGWPQATKGEEADLQTRLTAAFTEWMAAHNKHPTFFRVVDVEAHPAVQEAPRE